MATNLRDIFVKSFRLREDLNEDEMDILLAWVSSLERPLSQAGVDTSLSDISQQVEILSAQNDNVFRGTQTIQELSQITDDAGLLQAGEFRTGNGAIPGGGFTGGRFGWPGFVYGSDTYFLAGVANDVLQVGLSLTDGKIYFGAGAGIMDIDGIRIYEQAGDVNGQIRFFNDDLPDNFGFITMYDADHLRLGYYDNATGTKSGLRVDGTNAAAQVHGSFRVLDGTSFKAAFSTSVVSGAEGLTIYDVSDGTTELASFLGRLWRLRNYTAEPSYEDGYARLFHYDTGGAGAHEFGLRIKDGANEYAYVLGSSTGFMESPKEIYINAANTVDPYLRFRESSVDQGMIWYDVSADTLVVENELAGAILLMMDGTASTDYVSIYDKSASKDRFKFVNNGTLHLLEATTATPSYVADTAILFYDGAADALKVRTKQGATETETTLGEGGMPADGWVSAGETWSYASASTFTVSGDVTAKYQKGTKLKWTQTSVKYGVVASSSYSAPNTTVTILVNDDYTIANAAITGNYYSYIENPEGFPHWFNYTPTLGANGSMTFTGTTITTAAYAVMGLLVTTVITASGTTGGTANNSLTFTVPYTPAFGSNGYGRVTDTALVAAAVTASGATISVRKYDNSNYGLGASRSYNVTHIGAL